MPVPPITVQHLFSHYNSAESFLTAAANEKDPERQRNLAAVGHGFAALAQVDATWLVDRQQQ